MWLLLTGIIAVLYCLKRFLYFKWQIHKMRGLKRPDGESFIFGHWRIFRQPPEMLYKNVKSLSEMFYPHFYVRMFNEYCTFILSPEDCEIFLSTPKHSSKSVLYQIFGRWLKEGLLMSKGEKWQQRRKILTPAFHFNILKEFIDAFNEKSDELMEKLRETAGKEIDVMPLFHECSLQMIIETSLGYKSKINDSKLKKYLKAVGGMEKLFNQYIVRPWLRYYFILYWLSPFGAEEKKQLDVLHNYTKTIIKEKMEISKNNPSESSEIEKDDIYFGKKRRRMAMLDILLEAHRNGNQIDFNGICEEVDTFTFEGHDTIATALSFCVMNIANHPEIQNQIVEEINSVLEGEDRHTTYDDLQNMDLLERCIKESLRLYPSVHIISREVEEDTILHSGCVVAKGTLLVIPILFVHRNPEIYPEPEKFDPDRFLLENCIGRHPFAYLPFSAGPRNCIGQRFAMMELKVVLSAIIRKFQLVPVDTPDNLELRIESILRTNGIRVKFIPRV
uniref:uncharacterized protein LOC123682422 n=1 Tax=Harmonia axyridis TaxID=115357 RepID=UPI003B5052D2